MLHAGTGGATFAIGPRDGISPEMRRTLAILGSWIVLAGLGPVRAGGLDLSVWDQLLARHVDATGRIAYASWKATDRPALTQFMESLAGADPASYPTREERLAFWINAYNAAVIDGVLASYPLASVREVPRFFEEARYRVAGETVSLDTIENVRIRPVFEDARIHFSLVCAARSCPRLLPRAYTGADLAIVLDAQGRDFLADPAKNSFDPATGKVRVSRIFEWFRGDFERSAGSVVDFLKRYAGPEARAILERPGATIQYRAYDWKLNDQISP